MRDLPILFATTVGVLASGVACNRGAAPSAEVREAAVAASSAPEAAPPPALAIPSASVSVVVNPEGLPTYSGPTGSIEGRVLVQGPDAPDVPHLDVRPCPAALDTYGKTFRTGAARADGSKPLADAVVVVTGYTSFVPARSEAERVTIGVNCAYRKRTISMTFGQRIEVTNDTKLAFAPTLMGVFQPAVMIAPPEQNGDPVKIYPTRPGHYLLMDQLQTYVREDVYVLRQPVHTVTDLDGHFRIDGVPVGKLKISVQHPAINGSVTKDVEVRANVVESSELVLTYSPKDAGPPMTPPGKIIP
jgi:hypothetical protein